MQRLLVVDDLPEIGQFFAGLARTLHPKVEAVIESESRAALWRVEHKTFDVVVSDFRMRGPDGLDVLRAAHDHHPQGRRVLITSYNELPVRLERVRAARVDAYVQKPLHAQETILLLLDMLAGDAESLAAHRAHASALEQFAAYEEAQATR